MFKFSLLAAVCASSLLMAGSDEAAIEKGSNASAALVQTLGGELKAKMQAEGAIGSLHFCSQNALVLTDKVAKEQGVGIKRVSNRNRNPINRADMVEQALLNEWQKMLDNQQPLPPYVLRKGEGKGHAFYKPLILNADACLKCHGDIGADSPLGKEIRALYPEDKATGYKMGDLRGMIVVTIPD